MACVHKKARLQPPMQEKAREHTGAQLQPLLGLPMHLGSPDHLSFSARGLLAGLGNKELPGSIQLIFYQETLW